MNNNKMEVVAQLFGKTLGEEFAVRNQRSVYYHLAFTDKGLTVFGTNSLLLAWLKKEHKENSND